MDTPVDGQFRWRHAAARTFSKKNISDSGPFGRQICTHISDSHQLSETPVGKLLKFLQQVRDAILLILRLALKQPLTLLVVSGALAENSACHYDSNYDFRTTIRHFGALDMLRSIAAIPTNFFRNRAPERKKREKNDSFRAF